MPKETTQTIRLDAPLEIVASYSRKINLANYVKGHDYESVDLFASAKRNYYKDEATPELISALRREAYEECKNEVQAREAEIIDEFRKAAGLGGELYGEDYKQIAAYIQALYTAKTTKDVEKVVEELNDKKDDFNEQQITLLKSLVLKVKARI